MHVRREVRHRRPFVSDWIAGFGWRTLPDSRFVRPSTGLPPGVAHGGTSIPINKGWRDPRGRAHPRPTEFARSDVEAFAGPPGRPSKSGYKYGAAFRDVRFRMGECLTVVRCNMEAVRFHTSFNTYPRRKLGIYFGLMRRFSASLRWLPPHKIHRWNNSYFLWMTVRTQYMLHGWQLYQPEAGVGWCVLVNSSERIVVRFSEDSM